MAQLAPFRAAPEDFLRPPVLENQEGRPRGVGIEIEFIGPKAEAVARALAERFGGMVQEVDPHAYAVQDTPLGSFTVELDTRYAHPKKSPATGLGPFGKTVATLIGSAASLVLPCELVTGPIPIERLHEIDDIIEVLRRLGAKGTQDGVFYAFGLHFNPELPRLDAPTVATYLKAFLLLNAWLRREADPDTTRDLLGFADPFPATYVRQVVDPAYWPDLPTLIDDYLAANPTRNRDCDFLPLFLHLDPPRVRGVLPEEKIGARPTLHYRLPDARVSDPGWSIASDWNRWVRVERLAADRNEVDRLGQTFLEFKGETKSWADLIERVALH